MDHQHKTLRDRFSGRKVLITGASGFLGSHLAERFNQCGAEVHGTSRVQHPHYAHSIHWTQSDLLDLASVQRLIRRLKPDIIFHLAGQATGAPDLQLVLPTFQSLVVSTVNLLIAASDARCGRVVLMGSLNEPLPRQSEVLPGSPYAAAKLAGNAYGRMFHALYGLPVVIARLFMTYGPRQNPRKLIPYVTMSLLEGKAPRLSNAELDIDWIYIDDVIEGLLAAADKPNLEGTTVDLGSGSLTSVRSVVEQLQALIDPHVEPLFGALSDRPREHVRMANTAQTALRLGWKPAISLQHGLQLTVDWHRQYMKEPSKVSLV
jgi:nucleoside-diphosphate-sugar epimerase